MKAFLILPRIITFPLHFCKQVDDLITILCMLLLFQMDYVNIIPVTICTGGNFRAEKGLNPLICFDFILRSASNFSKGDG